jgi:hypothetical protein
MSKLVFKNGLSNGKMLMLKIFSRKPKPILISLLKKLSTLN